MKLEQKDMRKKFKTGIATLAIGATLLSVSAQSVHAEETVGSTNSESKVEYIAKATGELEGSETTTLTAPDITRHEGRNRAQVAINVAKAHFIDSSKVIIVNQDKYTDATSATNISQGRYPVLYTRAGKISPNTVELLNSMSLDEVYVLGGKNSINESVVSEIQNETGVQVTRLGGINRYDANTTAVRTKFDQSDHVVIASGEVYPDALYGVSYANQLDAPVILTNTDFLETQTVELLKDLNVAKATIIGGTTTVTTEVESQLSDLGISNDRIAGADRYEGSVEVANAAYSDPKNMIIASGDIFTDALVSAPFAQKLDAPILLARGNDLEAEVENYLSNKQLSTQNIYIQGGPNTITPTQEKLIEEATTYATKTQAIPFETKTEEDENLLEGKTEIIQTGANGTEEIFYNVIYDNGVEVSRNEVDRNIIDPVTKIVAKGTKVDLEVVNKIEDMINSLPEELMINDNEVVSDVRNEYETLTERQKAAVSNLNQLEQAEEGITQLESAFSFDSNRGIITDYDIAGGNEAVIPSTINGVEVKEIGRGAFEGKNIRSVIIPETINRIRSAAFEDNLLTTVELPDSISQIDYSAFQNNLLRNIKIPKNIEVINNNVFSHNNLTDVEFPKGLKRIERSAFYQNNLTDINLPDSIEYIGINAFRRNSLKKIVIPSNMTTIEGSSFSYNDISEIVIPENVTRIKRSAFFENNLTQIEIPENVQTIESFAFGSNQLEEVVFNEGLLNIEEHGFQNNNLTSISLPSSLFSIGNEAFKFNELTSIIVGSDVFIGDSLLSSSNNYFRNAYNNETNGGPGTYVKTGEETWTKQ